jgi:hypothetical protein
MSDERLAEILNELQARGDTEPALFTYGCLGARLVGIHPDI